MSKEIEDKVDALLAKWGIGFRHHYLGEVKVQTYSQDSWKVTFLKGLSGGSQQFEFFTGLGHRKLPPWGYKVRGYDNGPAPRPGTLLHERWWEQAQLVAPRAASVLHSLVLDSEAARMTFSEWCDELGYDADSRKAFATYTACHEEYDKLRKIFTIAQLDELREALEGY